MQYPINTGLVNDSILGSRTREGAQLRDDSSTNGGAGFLKGGGAPTQIPTAILP